MTPPLVLLRAEDATELAALHATADSSSWSIKAFRTQLEQPASLGLGIEQDGALAAFLLAQTTPDTAEILTLATAPARRRRGFARVLVEALIRRAGERGVARITLDVAEDNTPARALYDDLGFREDGRRPGYYRRDSAAIDAVLMSRDLGLKAGLDSGGKA